MSRMLPTVFCLLAFLLTPQWAQARNTSCEAIRNGGNGPNLIPGAEIKIPRRCRKSPSGGRYTVLRGQGWYKIAAIHGCKPGLGGALQVCSLNHGSQPIQRAPSRSGCTNCNWTERDLRRNSGVLKKLLKARGFKAPPKFRALVVKTILKGAGGNEIDHHVVYDYSDKAWTWKGWNPASTIKLFSATAAIARLNTLGFDFRKIRGKHYKDLNIKATFHYKRGDRTFDVVELFEKAAHISKNLPHNRLVQLAGFDLINGPRGILKQAGLNFSYIMNGYELSNWRKEGHSTSLRSSPAITIRQQNKRKRKLRAQKGRSKTKCYHSACTSLSDLAKFLCTLILHEQLPQSERIKDLDPRGCSDERADCRGPNCCRIQSHAMKFLRNRLNAKRRGRRDPVWDTLSRHFIPKEQRNASREVDRQGEPQLFRKSGWARNWASDVIYIYDRRMNRSERWIVAMACYGDRYCLGRGKKSAAKLISQLIKSNKL